MTLDEAGRILRKMYDDPTTDRVVSIHLFGIKYAEQIQDLTAQKIVDCAGLKKSYFAEVNKGKNLAKYVKLK